MKLKLPLIAAFVAVLGLTACGGGGSSSSADLTLTNPAAYSATETQAGTGAVAVAGSIPTIKYTGWLYSKTATNFKGAQFDTGTINANGAATVQPIKLGTNSLIAGFEQGVVGMKVGAKRTLLIPSNLAYGANSPSAAIPANSGLVFEIELTAVN